MTTQQAIEPLGLSAWFAVRWTEIQRRASAAWELDLVRLIVLTAYYLAIIVALVAIYGGSHYKPPPFIYQGF